MRRDFAGWDPQVEKLIRHVRTTFLWALYDRDPLPCWTKGNLALLGDAAHAMLPHLGQGANQSIEDGITLATLLSRAEHDSLPAALQAYERLRRERVAEVQTGARRNGLRYDTLSGDVEMRDREIVAHAEFRKQLYDYDVLKLASTAAISPAH
jgi:salicylate hydroxylase